MSGKTETGEAAAAGDDNLDFANERGFESEGKEVLLVGPSFPVMKQHRAEMSNEKSPGTKTVELIFAPAVAAIEIIKGTGNDTGDAFANAGYNPDESRVPAGQSRGGQWTARGAGGVDALRRKLQLYAPPSQLLLSSPGGMGPLKDMFDPSAPYSQAEYWSDVAKVWEGYGDAITETARSLWNTALHPITAAEGVAAGVAHLVRNPVGTLKAIGQQIADEFTSGDPRKAGKLVGLVLINLATGAATAEVAPLLRNWGAEKWAALVQKVEKAAAGEPVTFTAEEAEIVDKTLLKPYEVGQGHHIPAKEAFKGDPAYNPDAAPAIPKSELKLQGIEHTKVTGVQQKLYRAYAKTGQPLTWDAMRSIETQALVRAGMNPGAAQAAVAGAINALKAAGVKGPTKIPWGGR